MLSLPGSLSQQQSNTSMTNWLQQAIKLLTFSEIIRTVWFLGLTNMLSAGLPIQSIRLPTSSQIFSTPLMDFAQKAKLSVGK